jgi:FKBP-type peptidyl-prolyl cis-trans isomerase FklB
VVAVVFEHAMNRIGQHLICQHRTGAAKQRLAWIVLDVFKNVTPCRSCGNVHSHGRQAGICSKAFCAGRMTGQASTRHGANMKRTLLATALLVSLPVLAAEQTAATTPANPYTKEEDKAAYSIGFFTGKANVEHLDTLNVDAYVAGFRDAYAKKQPVMTEDEMKAVLDSFRQKVTAETQAKVEQETEDNLQKSEKYLAAHAKMPGVITTPSGLQYEVLTQGNGARPKASDVVKVQYQGTLIDGSVFDSSIQRGEPAIFELDQVIPGWTEALQLMPVGSKYRLTLPPNLAYGEQGVGPIPPNSVLIFEVELLSIEKPNANAPADSSQGSKQKAP